MTSEIEDVKPDSVAAVVEPEGTAAGPVTTEAVVESTELASDPVAETDPVGGLTVEQEAIVVESTGAVEFDGSPVTTEAVVDNTSTGAVALAGPVTVTVGWLADAQTKPVVAPVEATPTKRPKQAQTKATPAKVATK
jgi:hypothetical protein